MYVSSTLLFTWTVHVFLTLPISLQVVWRKEHRDVPITIGLDKFDQEGQTSIEVNEISDQVRVHVIIRKRWDYLLSQCRIKSCNITCYVWVVGSSEYNMNSTRDK